MITEKDIDEYVSSYLGFDPADPFQPTLRWIRNGFVVTWALAGEKLASEWISQCYRGERRRFFLD